MTIKWWNKAMRYHSQIVAMLTKIYLPSMRLQLFKNNRTRILAKNNFYLRSRTETRSRLQSRIVSSIASYPWLPDWRVNESKSYCLRRMTRSRKSSKTTVSTHKHVQTSTSLSMRFHPSTWRPPPRPKSEPQSPKSSKSSSQRSTTIKSKTITSNSKSVNWPFRSRLSSRRLRGCDCSRNSIR